MSTATSVRLDRVSGEINVTPLVDVCLVLLIIFMVVTPLLPGDVPLPATGSPKPIPELPSQLTITIENDASILVGRNRVPEAELERELSYLYAASPDRDIVIKADRNLRYEHVRKVMRRVREARFKRVGLITEREGKGSAPH